MRKTSEEGKDLVRQGEGLRLRAYKPTPNDVWTIGFGHTKGVYEGQVITREQAEIFLAEDLAEAEACVNRLCSAPITDNQFASLVSFAFNLGCNALAGSTLLRFVNGGEYERAAGEFGRWNKQRNQKTLVYEVLPGLTARRRAEKELFLA